MDILAKMPYGKDFLLVDKIQDVNDELIKGSYKFSLDASFYKDHFPGNPITPGVFLIESAAQIGLVAFGIYLLRNKLNENQSGKPKIAFTSSEIDFLQPALQGEEIFVEAQKIYFRFQKLKVSFKIRNAADQILATGKLAGMFNTNYKSNE